MDVERPCSWMLQLPIATLRCATHDVATYPWSPAEGCALPVAQVCHVCVRAAVPVASRFFWYFLCPRCRSIEARLARPLGHHSMTPHDGQAGNGRSSVYGRLFRDRLGGLEVEGVAVADDAGGARGANRVVTRDVSGEGSLWLTRLTGHKVEVATAMADEAFAGEDADPIPWAQWSERFPASALASARAYQEYVERLHPWIETVEPRVTDVEWLVGLVAAG